VLRESTRCNLPSAPAAPAARGLCGTRRRAGFRWLTLQRRMGAMAVVIPLERKKLHLQISRRPEQRPVQAFATNGADQAFDERMRERHVRHRLDFFDVEDAQICLPLVELVQAIMV
jgi:hypothetical protein